jgi:Tfp pilus assembly protein PilN
MNERNKRNIFVCQVTDTLVKLLAFMPRGGQGGEFISALAEPLPKITDDKILAEALHSAFKRAGYANNPLIISLPRNQATCRFLRVPSSTPSELEKIAQLQASHYLPYSSSELTTGYQIVRKDKEGFSYINLIIAHNEAINRYVKLFRELKPKEMSIVLSTYGLCSLYHYINPAETVPVMLIELDDEYAQLGITMQEKLFFSRSFKLPEPERKEYFVNEIVKTKDAYIKEVTGEFPSKIVLTGVEGKLNEYAELLRRETNFSVEALSFEKKVKISDGIKATVLHSAYSFAGLLGLASMEILEPLNLLPQDIKEKNKMVSKSREFSLLSVFAVAALLIFGAAIAKHLDNKARYLQSLKSELAKIEDEARPLEGLENRFKIMRQQILKKPSGLDIIYELYQVMPQQVSLVALSYEQDNQIILRGQTQERNPVFEFVSRLQNSQALKGFSVKLRYATQKKTQSGELVDFEIICSKR